MQDARHIRRTAAVAGQTPTRWEMGQRADARRDAADADARRRRIEALYTPRIWL